MWTNKEIRFLIFDHIEHFTWYGYITLFWCTAYPKSLKISLENCEASVPRYTRKQTHIWKVKNANFLINGLHTYVADSTTTLGLEEMGEAFKKSFRRKNHYENWHRFLRSAPWNYSSLNLLLSESCSHSIIKW